MVFHINRKGDLPVIRTDAYDVLEEGRFSPRCLRLHIQGRRKSYTPAEQDAIERTWDLAVQEAEEGGQDLFNGGLFSYLEHHVRKGTLNLLLGETDYKELVGTNLSFSYLPEGHDVPDLSDGIAVSTTLITRDGQLVLGRRSRKVHRGKGKLHVCAGHPDPERLLTVEEILSGENLFFAAMKQEIMEEFHISARDISQMTCLGLVRSRETRKPELIFATSLKIPARKIAELHASARDREEHDEVLFVPCQGPELMQFLKEHHQDLTVPGLAALVFCGVERGFLRSAAPEVPCVPSALENA